MLQIVDMSTIKDRVRLIIEGSPILSSVIQRDWPLHGWTHEAGGIDEISIADLSGLTADPQVAGWLYSQTYPVDLSTAPNTGEVLSWSGTAWVASVGGVAGLVEDQILFGSAAGTIEQSASLTFNDTQLYLDGALSINDNYIEGVTYIDLVQDGVDMAEARLWWDSDDGFAQIGMVGGNVSGSICGELLLRGQNNYGSTLSDGTAIGINGAVGNNPQFTLADISQGFDCQFAGILTESIAASQHGYSNTYGLIHNSDTSALTAGIKTWIGTSGELTHTQPPAGNMSIMAGYATRIHATEGVFLHASHCVPFLSYLSDVNARSQTHTDGYVLAWDAANGYWDLADPNTLISAGSATLEDGAIGYGDSSDLLTGDATYFSYDDINRVVYIGSPAGTEEVAAENDSLSIAGELEVGAGAAFGVIWANYLAAKTPVAYLDTTNDGIGFTQYVGLGTYSDTNVFQGDYLYATNAMQMNLTSRHDYAGSSTIILRVLNSAATSEAVLSLVDGATGSTATLYADSLDIDATDTDIDIDAGNAIYITATTALDLDAGTTADLTSAGNMTLESTGAQVIVDAATVLDLNATTDIDIDAGNVVYLTAVTGVDIDAGTTLDMTSAGNMSIESTGAAVDVDAVGDISITSSTGALYTYSAGVICDSWISLPASGGHLYAGGNTASSDWGLVYFDTNNGPRALIQVKTENDTTGDATLILSAVANSNTTTFPDFNYPGNYIQISDGTSNDDITVSSLDNTYLINDTGYVSISKSSNYVGMSISNTGGSTTSDLVTLYNSSDAANDIYISGGSASQIESANPFTLYYGGASTTTNYAEGVWVQTDYASDNDEAYVFVGHDYEGESSFDNTALVLGVATHSTMSISTVQFAAIPYGGDPLYPSTYLQLRDTSSSGSARLYGEDYLYLVAPDVIISGAINTNRTTVTATSSAATIDFSDNTTVKFIGGNQSAVTLTFTAPSMSTYEVGCFLKVVQGSTTATTITWPSSIIWVNETEPTISTDLDSITWIAFRYSEGVWNGFPCSGPMGTA